MDASKEERDWLAGVTALHAFDGVSAVLKRDGQKVAESSSSALSKYVQTPEPLLQEPIVAWPPCNVCPQSFYLSALLDFRNRYFFPSFEDWLPYFKDSPVDKQF